MRPVLTRLLALVVVSSALASQTAIPVRAQTPSGCQFVLGFLTLQQMIPDIVGQCIDDVSYDAEGNGGGCPAHYLRTGSPGFLVWQKWNNFTAFTDGYRTWANGPFGLQGRFNFQRFFWEPRSVWWSPEPVPVVPPTPVAAAHVMRQ